MDGHPYPEVSESGSLVDLEHDRVLEVAGLGRRLRLEDGDDPIEVAQRYMETHPWENRFRVVSVQRFSLPHVPGWGPFVPGDSGTCGATKLHDGTQVTCSLSPHSEGVDHAGRVLQGGRPMGVHYWRASARTP